MINVDILFDVYGMNYGDISQGGLLGDEFSDVMSLRFDGVVSVVVENVEIKEGN